MAALVCLGVGLRVANVGNVALPSPDERVYTHQAWVWLESGHAGIRSMVEQYKADPATRLYPPPTRVGMYRLVAAMMQWTGRNDETVGEKISCAASIGSLLLLALIGLRFLPRWAAVAALLFYSVLPAELAIARRTWPDALVELAGFLLIWFACEITRNPGRRIWYALFALVGGIGMMVKESMPLPEGLCALWILCVLARRRDWTSAAILISATVVGITVSLCWLSDQVGSLGDYAEIVAGIPRANSTNSYALVYASGPPFLVLLAFWIVAPIPSLLCLAGLYGGWRRGNELPGGSAPVMGMAFFLVAHVALAMLVPHWINLRYISVAFGPFCLFAGLGCWYLISAGNAWLEVADRRPFVALAVAIVIGGGVADYLRFRRVFVLHQTADLSVKMLVDERNQ